MTKDTKSPRKKILFTIGSPNQTSQMHQIASHLADYDCFFTQIYSKHPVVKAAVRMGVLDTTILAGEFRRRGDAYLEKHRLRNDYAREIYHNNYDLTVLCSDLLVTKELRKGKTVWVQEGMTDPITSWGKWTRRLGLPGYWAANTAFNGSGNICDIYCAASPGYREQFGQLGTDVDKIVVTGIPNYDNAAALLNNDFPYSGYVMVATSDNREVNNTFEKEDRPAFIRRCVRIAAGRPLLFKLHPNEKKERAIEEIRQWAPSAAIYTEGNTEQMIANCDELITQYSTVVYIGIALGKKVHSYFDVDQLRKLAPIQNGGTSAARIADLCRRYIEFEGPKDEFLRIVRTATNTISLHERERADHYHYSNQEGVFPSA
ncbi:hypothetical protein [Puia dinghuensis]|uniref:UDP-N-acetyl glucosamine 2-epimerase n=1 Tax=Puia dinghuensis TaxID=1792502 RepID=A0A8J2XRU8_9BACT|nr:hypothetical protein [Puia dinghuensis]GGA90514.1 hypothetical protein GCM10011511_12200 [Puia dinghuensis]